MGTEPHLEVLTQHIAGRLAVPGASGAAEVNVVMDFWFGDYFNVGGAGRGPAATIGEDANHVDAGVCWACAGCDVIGPACDIVTQARPLHLTIETPWGLVRFTMPFIVLPGRGDVVISGQNSLREKLGIYVMAQLKASVIKAHRREDDDEMETTAGAVGEHLDVFRRTLLGDPPARMEPMTVRLQPGARAVWAKRRASSIMHIPGDDNYWGKMLSRWVTQPGRAVYVHESVTYTEVLYAWSDKFQTNEVVRWVQAAAVEGGPTRDTWFGVASLDSERL